MPSIDEYHAYHSMLCSSSTAKRCGDSFQQSGGTITFVPSGQALPIAHYVCANKNGNFIVFAYYLMVLCSLTGLSTLLGMTEFISHESIEINDQAAIVMANDNSSNVKQRMILSPHLRSKLNPSIAVSLDTLRYIAEHSKINNLSECRIVRKFEYNFQLVGLNVIMLHLTSPSKVERNLPRLHLVEVYEFRSSLLNTIAGTMMICWNKLDTVGSIYSDSIFNRYKKET